MTERETIEICKICETEGVHLCSGSMNKKMCMNCGFSEEELFNKGMEMVENMVKERSYLVE